MYTSSKALMLSACASCLKVIITICLRRDEDEVLVCPFASFLNERLTANKKRAKNIFFMSVTLKG